MVATASFSVNQRINETTVPPIFILAKTTNNYISWSGTVQKKFPVWEKSRCSGMKTHNGGRLNSCSWKTHSLVPNKDCLNMSSFGRGVKFIWSIPVQRYAVCKRQLRWCVWGKKTVLSSTKPLVLEAAWYCILLTLRKGTQNINILNI